MKQTLLALSWLLIGTGSAISQTTATDFTINDCSGTSHHLFAELDAGTVIVVSFVMPCVGCILPSYDAQTVVETYAVSHPGKVVMYLADDDAATPCTTLGSWRNANGLHVMPTFSDPAFVQDQYGTPAMPKIVVLGGTGHHIYHIADNSVNTADLKNAIDAAIAGLPPTTGLKAAGNKTKFSVFPNPASDHTAISYSGATPGILSVQLIDSKGSVIKDMHPKTHVGDNNISINLSGVAPGAYFIRVADDAGTTVKKLIVR